MTVSAVQDKVVERDLERVIGRVVGVERGPTLIFTGSLHGNEPAGFRALRRVFAKLEETRPPLRGELLGLLGNRAALEARRRYVTVDLNRHWHPARVAASRAGELADSSVPEDRELDELRRELEAAFERARGDVYLLDLHTTSGEGPPFVTMSDQLANRAFALHFPAPIIVGLEEELEGTLTDYADEFCYVAIGFEGGQHDDPASVDQAEAAVWIALVTAGLLDAHHAPDVDRGRVCMAEICRGLPRIFEIRHRHRVEEGFRMEPGFRSFQDIRAGQLLAHDAGGPVHALEDGKILMPLYQEQGEDGYFEIREFSPFWLRVSATLRKLHADALLHWLPGVNRHPDLPDALIVDRRVARLFALEIFHLLGYRRHRNAGERLVISRRRERHRMKKI